MGIRPFNFSSQSKNLFLGPPSSEILLLQKFQQLVNEYVDLSEQIHFEVELHYDFDKEVKTFAENNDELDKLSKDNDSHHTKISGTANKQYGDGKTKRPSRKEKPDNAIIAENARYVSFTFCKNIGKHILQLQLVRYIPYTNYDPTLLNNSVE
jgi:hypothetical protein